nr:MAG TPA: hypothetical protein [Caudoviricetes sp.]
MKEVSAKQRPASNCRSFSLQISKRLVAIFEY